MPASVQSIYTSNGGISLILPVSLSKCFTAQTSSRDWPVDSQTYANGEYQSRIPTVFDPVSGTEIAVQQSRRSWTQTKRLTPTQYFDLISFFLAVGTLIPFWFYDLFETVPLLTWDATASAVQGRYAVRFVGSPTPALIGGPGNGTIRPGRAIQAGIGLIEVA